MNNKLEQEKVNQKKKEHKLRLKNWKNSKEGKKIRTKARKKSLKRNKEKKEK